MQYGPVLFMESFKRIYDPALNLLEDQVSESFREVTGFTSDSLNRESFFGYV